MNVWIRGRCGVLDRVPGRVDVGHVGPRQTRDHRSLNCARDRLHGLEVARRGDRKARLDHVDAQPRELLCDLQLLLRVQRDAGRLLAVTQRGVEDQILGLGVFGLGHVTPQCLGLGSSRCWFRGYVRPPTRYSPRGGRRRSRRSRRSAIPRRSVPGASFGMICAVRRLALIVNPVAGGGRPARALPDVQAALARRGSSTASSTPRASSTHASSRWKRPRTARSRSRSAATA